MPAGPGAIDAHGIYQYGEADLAAPVSDVLNLLAGSTSTQVASIRAILDAEAVASAAPWSSWTPNLTAATTNPNLGTGNSRTGKYKVKDRVCTGWANIACGGTGSGVTPGSGTYRIALPAAAALGAYVIGDVFLFDASSSTRYMGVLQADSLGAFAVLTIHGMTSEWGSSGGPIILADSDFVRVRFTYETQV